MNQRPLSLVIIAENDKIYVEGPYKSLMFFNQNNKHIARTSWSRQLCYAKA